MNVLFIILFAEQLKCPIALENDIIRISSSDKTRLHKHISAFIQLVENELAPCGKQSQFLNVVN